MTDLLTHVLAAYVLATLGTWQLECFHDRYVPLAMVGSVIPDTAKVYLLTGSLRATVGSVEISWLALQTLGAALTIALAGSLLVPPAHRRPVLASLVGGVLLHIGLDYPVIRAGGYAPPYLYPVTWVQLPSLDLYLSSDVWPAGITALAALLVWTVQRYRSKTPVHR